jgi:hypothetical protein
MIKWRGVTDSSSVGALGAEAVSFCEDSLATGDESGPAFIILCAWCVVDCGTPCAQPCGNQERAHGKSWTTPPVIIQSVCSLYRLPPVIALQADTLRQLFGLPASWISTAPTFPVICKSLLLSL